MQIYINKFKTKNMKNLLFIVVLLLLIIAGCTDNQRARSFGGKEEVVLKPNEILTNMTWKGEHLWIQTRDTVTGLEYFREKSSYGLLEGQIIVKMNRQR